MRLSHGVYPLCSRKFTLTLLWDSDLVEGTPHIYPAKKDVFV